jgi:predicted transcriptional regulator of viral defense system
MPFGFQQFRVNMGHFPVFSLPDIRKKFPSFDRKRLVEWQQKGYILPVCRGFYAWPDAIKTIEDKWAFAGKVYSPSYVSLQSALSHYGFIPEGVFSVTSVSTLKTREFEAMGTAFKYRSIKPELFFGYGIHSAPDGQPYCLAFPEKALLDMLYFHPELDGEDGFEAFRLQKWQIREVINPVMFTDFGDAMGGKKFAARWRAFLKWAND